MKLREQTVRRSACIAGRRRLHRVAMATMRLASAIARVRSGKDVGASVRRTLSVVVTPPAEGGARVERAYISAQFFRFESCSKRASRLRPGARAAAACRRVLPATVIVPPCACGCTMRRVRGDDGACLCTRLSLSPSAGRISLWRRAPASDRCGRPMRPLFFSGPALSDGAGSKGACEVSLVICATRALRLVRFASADNIAWLA